MNVYKDWFYVHFKVHCICFATGNWFLLCDYYAKMEFTALGLA